MDKPRRTWPWIVAVLIGVPVLYVASFGPACWIADRAAWPSQDALAKIYAPLLRPILGRSLPECIVIGLAHYADAGATQEDRLLLLLATRAMEDYGMR